MIDPGLRGKGIERNRFSILASHYWTLAKREEKQSKMGVFCPMKRRRRTRRREPRVVALNNRPIEPEPPPEAQGEGLSFVTKAHPTEVEGMTSLMPGLSGIAEPVRSVFSHACAVCTLCLLLFVLSGSW